MGILIIAVAASTLVAGLVGFFLGKSLSSSAQKKQALEQHLHQTQDELKHYQLEVTQHFSETAQLLKKMAESYRDVHNHLASGANTLSKDGSGLPLMQKLPELETITSLADDPVAVAPPLDYAPKSSPYDRGTLASDHHLEKVNLHEDLEGAEQASPLAKH